MCNGPWANKAVALFLFSACITGAVWSLVLLGSLISGLVNTFVN